jgi:hypothetical protein
MLRKRFTGCKDLALYYWCESPGMIEFRGSDEDGYGPKRKSTEPI